MTKEERVAIANEFFTEHDTTYAYQSELSGINLDSDIITTKEEVVEVCKQMLDTNCWFDDEDEDFDDDDFEFDEDDEDDDYFDDEEFEDIDDEDNGELVEIED